MRRSAAALATIAIVGLELGVFIQSASSSSASRAKRAATRRSESGPAELALALSGSAMTAAAAGSSWRAHPPGTVWREAGPC